MENLKAPRAFKALPRFLSAAQVEALLEAPDVAHARSGVRDRAILEVLYATGLRVSELIVAARRRTWTCDLGLVTCFGKGRKERLVPARRRRRSAWVRRYLDEVRETHGARPRARRCCS